MDGFLEYDLVSGNTVADALWFLGYLVLTFGVARLVQVGGKGVVAALVRRSQTRVDDVLLDALAKPIYWIVMVVGFRAAIATLKLPEGVNDFFSNTGTVLMMMLVAWGLSSLISQLRVTYLDPLAARTSTKLDDQVIPIVEKSLKVSVWAFALLIAFDNIGFDVVSLLTGLGIGGLALAMAAKDTLANVFGSVTIFADQPFQVGDNVTLKGRTGTVTSLGLRVCRLTMFDGTVVTVPNALLVGDVIENLSVRPARRFLANLGLVYDTPSEQLEAAIATVKDILGAHPKVREDYKVRFGEFGESALLINVLYWVVPPGDYLDVVGEVNLEIKRRFDAAGHHFAFPTMTIHQAKD